MLDVILYSVDKDDYWAPWPSAQTLNIETRSVVLKMKSQTADSGIQD